MNNKSKPDQNKSVQNMGVSKRPKRCHLCKKSYPPQKYNQHFQMCYRFQNQKIQESRTRTTYKTNPTKVNTLRTNTPLKQEPNRGKNLMNPERPPSSNKFRIKNSSNASGSQNPSNLVTRPNLKQPLKKNDAREAIKQQFNRRQVQNREENKKEERRKEEQKKETKVQETDGFERASQISSIQSRQAQRVEERVQPIRFQQSRRQPVQEIRIPQEIQPMRAVQPPVLPEVLPNMFVPLQEEQLQPQQPAHDIQTMVQNSNSIIQFISSSSFMMQDQALNIMMTQLQQLNLIAQQIAQLNQLGRSLSFRVGNVFAARIHELQSAIINQIGIAIVRGFTGRLGDQFQVLTFNQPQLKVGLTEHQIEATFEEKFNLTQTECSICLQDMKRSDMVLQLQCNHAFHPCCIKEWLTSSKKCPLCRKVQCIMSK